MFSVRQWRSSRYKLGQLIRIRPSGTLGRYLAAYRRMHFFIPPVTLSTNSLPHCTRTCSIRPRTLVACAEPSTLPIQDVVVRRGLSTSTSDYEIDEINEDEIEEQFVRGSGPGGQKINKTASCVVLKHKPTGIMVKCQEGRSQAKNRQLARKLLAKKLDEIKRGEESLAARELSKARARKARRRRKSVKKHFKSKRDMFLFD